MLEANSAVIPLLLPLIGGILSFFIPKGRLVPTIFLLLSLCYSLWLLMTTYSGVIFVTHLGGWAAPYGITLVVDSFSALMLFFTNLIFLLATLYGFTEDAHFCRLPLILLLQAGVSLSFITADFFNLFVSFEILLTASYALLLIEIRNEDREKAFPYVMINVVGSFIFLMVAAMVYGATGSLNMAVLHSHLAESADNTFILCLGASALIIYGLKAGVFPFYFWLPGTYPLLPSSLAGLFGGVLTKVGVYVLVRLFVTVLPHSLSTLHLVLLFLSGLTMFLGVLGAICQKTIKKILSYHILSQIGYMILGLGMFTVNALAAGLLFVIHNIFVKSSLFWIGGEAARRGGSEELGKIKPVWGIAPLLGVCFLLQGLSLAGIPPLSGFWGKYLLISSTLVTEHYILLVIALVTSFWTLFSMIKIWLGAFWGEGQAERGDKYPVWALLPIMLSVVVALTFALGIEEAYRYSMHAAEELFTPQRYVQAILGGN